MTAIQVNNLEKVYRLYPASTSRIVEAVTGKARHTDCRALDGVSFDVPSGKTVGVIGRNGSGKSTLLRILAGIMDPTAGSFEIGGKVVPLLELGAGFIPQLKGVDNILINGRMLGLSKSVTLAKVDSILEFAELGEFADQPVRTYSSGMLLRLGFAIAQSIDPDVLLVDEVLAVGDAAFQKKCVSRIDEIRARGATVLIVSHSLADIAGLCAEVVQLDAGRIVRKGSTEDVIRAYLEELDDSTAGAGAPILKGPNPHRKNTNEISVESVELIGPDGNPATLFNSGERITIKMSYKVSKPVNNPMFRIQMFRSDGLFVHGTNTYRHGLNTGEVVRDGSVELIYDSLNLLAGRYWINVGVYPDEYGKAISEHAYDLVENAAGFDVRSERPDGAGIATMRHEWKLP